LAKKTNDPNGKETYNSLAKFEKTHVTKIKSLMEKFK
jgi:hypothetical protein